MRDSGQIKSERCATHFVANETTTTSVCVCVLTQSVATWAAGANGQNAHTQVAGNEIAKFAMRAFDLRKVHCQHAREQHDQRELQSVT